MAIVNLKMGNLGLEVQSLITRLTMVEGGKHGLLLIDPKGGGRP